MTRAIRALGIIVLAAVAGFALMAATGERDASSQPLPASAPVHMMFAAGVVEPQSEERDLAATVVGRLISVKSEGDTVRTGEVVAEVENDDRKAALDSAEARLAMRQGELAKLLAGAREEERKEAEAALHEVEAQLKLTKNVVERRGTLAQTGFASSETVDHAEADYAAAIARENLMAQRLALINAPPRVEDVAIAQANVAEAKADIANAQAQLEMTRLRSPIDGVLLKRYKLPGEAVTNLPPTLVASVGDIGHLRVRVQIDETDVARVAVGQHVLVTADAFGDRHFSGKVITVGTRLGPKYLKTEMPTERVDTKILEAIVDLDGNPPLPIGLRVDVALDPTPSASAAISDAAQPGDVKSDQAAVKTDSNLVPVTPSSGPDSPPQSPAESPSRPGASMRIAPASNTPAIPAHSTQPARSEPAGSDD
jgi:HlyD family secretion protein